MLTTLGRHRTATDSGAVYVFVRNGAQWTQQAYVKAQTVGSVLFGARVALSADGQTFASSSISNGGIASVSVYERTATT